VLQPLRGRRSRIFGLGDQLGEWDCEAAFELEQDFGRGRLPALSRRTTRVELDDARRPEDRTILRLGEALEATGTASTEVNGMR